MPPRPVTGHNLLADKTALVTVVAGTDIGSAVAQRCLEHGTRIAISDQHERRLAEKAADLGVVGVRATSPTRRQCSDCSMRQPQNSELSTCS